MGLSKVTKLFILGALEANKLQSVQSISGHPLCVLFDVSIKKNFGCIFPGLQQILSDKCLKLPPVFPNCSIYAELSKIIINDVILLFYSHHRTSFYRIFFTEEIPLKIDQSRGFNSSMKLLHMYAMHTHTQ